jgi:hypothetical protein
LSSVPLHLLVLLLRLRLGLVPDLEKLGSAIGEEDFKGGDFFGVLVSLLGEDGRI